MDGDPGDAGALLREPPLGERRRREIGSGDCAYLGVEREAHPQLLEEGEVGVGGEGGLEVRGDEEGVWEELVVDLLLRRVPFSAGILIFSSPSQISIWALVYLFSLKKMILGIGWIRLVPYLGHSCVLQPFEEMSLRGFTRIF